MFKRLLKGFWNCSVANFDCQKMIERKYIEIAKPTIEKAFAVFEQIAQPPYPR
jgi:hypothetical protein